METTLSTRRSWIRGSAAIALCLIVLDQVTKVIVLNTMSRGESIPVLGSWLRLTFTENPGMAFGVRFGPPAMITILSIVATVIIAVYLVRVAHIHTPYRVSLTMVLGGALGNIIDRVFYGHILYDQPFFLGHVVDFIHVDLWRGFLPEGLPIIGGSYIALFPIWNVADMAIVLGVVGILIFQGRFHEAAIRLEQPAELPGEAGSEGDDSGEKLTV